MSVTGDSVLLIGESGVGKTHYGAQLLRRLMNGDGLLRMNGQATNLDPFEAALARLDEGMSADHTATSTYVDSLWPVSSARGRQADLVWPDYGGEQIRSMIASRRVPTAWATRARDAKAWLLLIRLQAIRTSDDIFSRQLADLRDSPASDGGGRTSDQARLIELLQMLIYVAGVTGGSPIDRPRLGVLLTCWDELDPEQDPGTALASALPMLWDFLHSSWRTPSVMGLSALGRALKPDVQDDQYVAHGAEHFGYVIRTDGSRSPDLTEPIHMLLDETEQPGAQGTRE
ncbi:hypothetical protein [Microtetraspora sp. NBRC 16547]|uniref:TRAFAC clade GTPase domain-containing protein n=1 Tax=Microtetraspora sp. NBRC 16547 TaxID=3030993 RepID=UPI0024A37231|nr:hypothetical protein [Microtetraspora sp. NBRC 16547]GLW98195.1 hypothetical protein Misp02_22820 [Microtetraspora sp. NBRC 16547]